MTGNPVEPDRIRDMFDTISGVYDPMNTFISGFQEPRWRRRAVRAAALATRHARRRHRDRHRQGGAGAVAGGPAGRGGGGHRLRGGDARRSPATRYADRDGLTFTTGDALALPVPDATFDAATIAFGMRNLADYRQGFAEMARAVKPGGRVVCLEIARPQSLVARVAQALVRPDRARSSAESPASRRRTRTWCRAPRTTPSRTASRRIMRDVGLVDVSWQPMTLGIVTLHVGRRPA